MVSEATKSLLEEAYSEAFVFEEGRQVCMSERIVQGYFIEPVGSEDE